jgi:hypothetical protein
MLGILVPPPYYWPYCLLASIDPSFNYTHMQITCMHHPLHLNHSLAIPIVRLIHLFSFLPKVQIGIHIANEIVF